MLELVAERGCGYVLMHIEGPPRVDRPAPRYDDVVDHLRGWFAERLERADGARRRSRSRSRSTRASTSTSPPTTTSRSCAASASCASSAGRCSSPSRARTSSARSPPAPGSGRLRADERGPATMAAAALAAAAGAEVLRLHDVEALDAMRTAAAIAGVGRRDRASPTLRRSPGSGCSRRASATSAWSTTSVEPARGPRTVAAPAALSGALAAALRAGRDHRALLAPGRGAGGRPRAAT